MQPFYRSFTVLIVGSNGKCNHYKNELQSLGLEVITYDSFEESPQRLKDQYPKADIVIICTSHIRHFVTGIIDVHASNITQIEKDSVVTICTNKVYGSPIGPDIRYELVLSADSILQQQEIACEVSKFEGRRFHAVQRV